MKAWIATEDGPRLAELPEPEPRDSDVCVRVRSAALNRVDLAMSAGSKHGNAGGIGAPLGVEFVGEVIGAGPAVRDVGVGDRVMGAGAGAFAEVVRTDYGRVLPVPPSLGDSEAAGLPVALQTMHDALVTQGQLAAGQSVFIHGASSGVGLMGLRIARTLGAGLVLGSARDPRRRDQLVEWGADAGIDPQLSGWEQRILERTDGRGVDLVIDQVSGPQTREMFRATRIGGRIINVGRLGGTMAEFDFDLHALRRLHYVGVTFRTRSREELREITRRVLADLWTQLEARELMLPIDQTYAFSELPAALDHMRANRHFGKIVISGSV